MKSEIPLGKNLETNYNFEVDLPSLIENRFLIQANSGGGKSWAVRKLLEKTNGKVQQIVLDIEGEFATLREKYDYMLIGKSGDIPISLKIAPLLPKKLLELKANAIIDLYELKKHERIQFVKTFLENLVDVDKSLWGPCLVVVDEAHQFCPEKDKAESGAAVTDLCTRGRKRGFCAVLATQRLSKLNKDAAAECNNKLIGRTGLDVDMKRAADELGFTSKEQYLSLRDLEVGEFFTFGPSISKKVMKVKIGQVETSHPKVGMRQLTVQIAAPAKIKAFIEKLKGLPQEVEKKQKERQELIQEIQDLKRKLTSSLKTVEPKIDQESIAKAYKKGFDTGVTGIQKDFFKRQKIIQQKVEAAEGNLNGIKIQLIDFELKDIEPFKPAVKYEMPIFSQVTEAGSFDAKLKVRMRPSFEFENNNDEDSSPKFGGPEKKILSVLYINQKSMKKVVVAFSVDYSTKSTSFIKAVSILNSAKLIQKEGDCLRITQQGIDSAQEICGDTLNSFEPLSIQLWAKGLPLVEGRIFNFLLKSERREYSKEEVAAAVNYSPVSTSFIKAVSRLNSFELIKKPSSASIRLNEELEE